MLSASAKYLMYVSWSEKFRKLYFGLHPRPPIINHKLVQHQNGVLRTTMDNHNQFEPILFGKVYGRKFMIGSQMAAANSKIN